MERPGTIENVLQDMEKIAPHGTLMHDKKRLAGYGADQHANLSRLSLAVYRLHFSHYWAYGGYGCSQLQSVKKIITPFWEKFIYRGQV